MSTTAVTPQLTAFPQEDVLHIAYEGPIIEESKIEKAFQELTHKASPQANVWLAGKQICFFSHFVHFTLHFSSQDGLRQARDAIKNGFTVENKKMLLREDIFSHVQDSFKAPPKPINSIWHSSGSSSRSWSRSRSRSKSRTRRRSSSRGSGHSRHDRHSYSHSTSKHSWPHEPSPKRRKTENKSHVKPAETITSKNATKDVDVPLSASQTKISSSPVPHSSVPIAQPVPPRPAPTSAPVSAPALVPESAPTPIQIPAPSAPTPTSKLLTPLHSPRPSDALTSELAPASVPAQGIAAASTPTQKKSLKELFELRKKQREQAKISVTFSNQIPAEPVSVPATTNTALTQESPKQFLHHSSEHVPAQQAEVQPVPLVEKKAENPVLKAEKPQEKATTNAPTSLLSSLKQPLSTQEPFDIKVLLKELSEINDKVERENQKYLCIKCKNLERRMVFKPCGHILLCDHCFMLSYPIPTCEICHAFIKECVRATLR